MNVALHPDPRPLDVISLCTGGGGLDLGLELAIPGARPVCLVEREAFAVAHLVEAMRQGLMAPAPVWSDARTFRGREWRGLVDGVIGGIPCQPHSLAGRKRGSHDERDLWSAARRIIVQARPWFVLIENVSGMLAAGDDEIAGAERVWRDLQKLGFAVEGGLFTASEVGAPHPRERVFVLALAMVDPSRNGWRERWSEPELWGRRNSTTSPGSPMAHGDGRRLTSFRLSHGGADGSQQDIQSWNNADRCHPAIFPPGPTDAQGWQRVLREAPHLVPAVRGMADGMASRVDRLRMLGNGVVPLEAAYAVRTLLPRLAAAGSSAAAFLVRVMENQP